MGLHSGKGPGVTESREPEGGLEGARGRRREQGVVVTGLALSFGKMKKFGSGWIHDGVNGPSATDLHTHKRLGCYLWLS